MLAHGDDFVILADDLAIDRMYKLLASKYTVKLVACIGDGPEVQEEVILNRIVRYVPVDETGMEVMELEGDQRHAELIVEQLEVGNMKAVVAAGVDTAEGPGDEEEAPVGRI